MLMTAIEPVIAKKHLDAVEKQLRNRFEMASEKISSSRSEGVNYGEKVRLFLEDVLGGAFHFSKDVGILDIELKVYQVLERRNSFDVVAVYRNAIPKLNILEGFVPYDSVAFVIKVTKSLRIRELKKELTKLSSLDELKVSNGRFRSYLHTKHTGTLQSTKGMLRPLRILFYRYGLTRKSSQKEAGRLLFNEYKTAWDIFIALEKHPVVFLNATLPWVDKVAKYFLHSNQYPLVHAMYAICLSVEGLFVDGSTILLNLLRSYSVSSVKNKR